MQRSKSFALLFLLGAFLAGGALGFTADRVMTRDKPCHKGSRHSVERLARELNLTPAQRVQVDSIMSRRRTQMREVFRPLRPQMDSLARIGRAISDSTHEQLKRVLTPEQRVKLDAMREKGRKESRDGGRFRTEDDRPAPKS